MHRHPTSVDADPDLGDLLEEPDRERARREALTRVRHLSPGDWDAARAIEPLCMLWCLPGFLRNEWTHAFKLLRQ